MTIKKVMEYILHTPYNTNKAILEELLKSLILAYGGTLSPDDPDNPDGPDVPNDDVIYDGGEEV